MWFDERLTQSIRDHNIRSYIVGVLASRRPIFAGESSFTLEYIDAIKNGSFEQFQSLADGITFNSIVLCAGGEHVCEPQHTIAKLSYLRCHKILDKKWPIYEELADTFCSVVDIAQTSIINHR